MLERIQLGNVTIYGDKNTGADFAKSFIKNFTPALDIVNDGFKDKFKEVFGLDKKKEELPNPEEKNSQFEEVE